MTDTIVLTIDNLGEAAEIEQGTWPAEAARGRHPSVTRALPRLLDLLDALALRATFFVEAINTREYPAALLEIAARGHEVGFHAWRHERWGDLAADDEQDVIDRSFAAYAQLGLDVRAFRPPGGGLNPHTTRRLRAAGVSWCSAKGERAGVDDAAMAHLPFRWDLVDATYLYRPFAGLRAERGLPERAARAGEQWFSATSFSWAPASGHTLVRRITSGPAPAARRPGLVRHFRRGVQGLRGRCPSPCGSQVCARFRAEPHPRAGS